MKLTVLRAACWWGGLASLVATCQPGSRSASQPPAVPLLEAVPVGYCPVDRQDTLSSYWAPPADLSNPSFNFTRAHRSEVVLQVHLVPASATHRPELDTLTFRALDFGHGRDRAGLNWFFDLAPRDLTSALLDVQGEPIKVFSARLYPLVVTEERPLAAGRPSVRNRYSTEYPFCPVAVAHLGDSVTYVRAYLLRGNVPQADTLYAASSTAAPRRLPHAVNLLDTTQLALLRFSLRQLRHSPTPAGY
jgi:hypothetical protein